MEKLNVRFSDEIKKEIEDVAKQQKQTFSLVAREAIYLGLEVIKHSPAYKVQNDK